MPFRIIYADKASTFEKLLEKDSSVSIHTRNLCLLADEMFKVVKGLALTIINDLFPLKETNNLSKWETNNLRHKLFFKIPRNETSKWFQKHIIFRSKNLGNVAIKSAGIYNSF